jgi:hypothetical protein
MEGATAESFAIPFLMVLQKGSPQVDPDHPKGGYVEGAKAGMLFNNISGTLIDGKTGTRIVPCAYRRVFIRWGSEASGEGFKGELTPEEVAAARADGTVKELENRLYIALEDGTVNEKKCDRISDTRNHYVLLLDEEGSATEALLSLSSTQIKKSKMLMSALANVKLKTADGAAFTPATFANIVHVTTVPESNEKGTWYGLRFAIDGTVSNDVYRAAKVFHSKVVSGAVIAKYDEPSSADAVGEEGRRF